jgi:hypothetical protein
MKKSYAFPKTKRLGAEANDQGAYTCPPDEVARWSYGREYSVEAKLLVLDDERVAYGVDYQFKDGGRAGPIFHSKDLGDRAEAIAGVVDSLEYLLPQAKARGVPPGALKQLAEWIKRVRQGHDWVDYDEGDGESMRGIDPKHPPQPSAGRQAAAPAEVEVITNEDMARVTTLVSEADARARAVAESIGYLLPADSTEPDLICRDITANMQRSVQAVLEIGKGLLVLKAACGHGMFMDRLDKMGVDDRLARRFMQAATRFSNVSTSTHLLPKIGSRPNSSNSSSSTTNPSTNLPKPARRAN